VFSVAERLRVNLVHMSRDFSGRFRHSSAYKASFRKMSGEFGNTWDWVPSQESQRWCEEERQTWSLCISSPLAQSAEQTV